ncbi:uncharacterized protein LOC110882777 [Helianthus annuus]|uniref:uncharacterized protein LOC110882777 n=1 Tax=Helianthus annuus TaxID=4232 RepID=UPI000B8F0CA2|nr:uncharacterized protein LOC110882777 [Helianthus annuus]
MNFATLNVRGLGVQAKKSWFRGLRLEQQIGCVLFQETFCNNVGAKQIEGFWGRGCFDFASVDPTGRSGGLITMWDTSIFCLQPIISNRNLLVCSGHIVGSGETINIINVYAPQGDVEKRHLWSVLISIIRGSNGLWIVGGDFNSVRNEHERRNSIFNPAAARDFNDFIEDAGLHELWPSAEYRVLPKGLPDHCPVVLKTFSTNFGPKPFRFFNSWLDRGDFEDVILKANSDFQGYGLPDLMLLQKFKFFRSRINDWKSRTNHKELEETMILKRRWTCLIRFGTTEI